MSESFSDSNPNESILSLLDFDEPQAPYERLARALEARVMMLEVNGTPDVERIEGIDILFGRDGLHLLNGSLNKFATGQLSGTFNVQATAANPTFLPRVTRDPETNKWTYAAKSTVFDDFALLRKFDHNWPSDLYDNTIIREAAREVIDTLQPNDRSLEIYEIFREQLLPSARQAYFSKEYIYYDIAIEDDHYAEVQKRDYTTLQVSRQILEHSDQPLLTIKLERSAQTIIDGIDVVVRCIAECDEDGNMATKTYYIDPDTSKIIDIPVQNEEALVDEFMRSLDALVAEKIGMTSGN